MCYRGKIAGEAFEREGDMSQLTGRMCRDTYFYQ